jgi:hypothetical protein
VLRLGESLLSDNLEHVEPCDDVKEGC